MTSHRITPLALSIVLALAVTACGDGDATDTTATTESTTTTAAETTTTSGPATTATSAPTTTAAPETTTTTTGPGETVIVYLFVEAEPGFPVLTPVAMHTPAAEGLEGAAIQALVDGPPEAMSEQEPPLTTAVPEGTRFLGISLDGGIATIDMTAEFGSGGGSMAMFSRLAQVTYTATRFPSIEGVRIALDGQVVDVFSGEGFDLSEPITRSFFDDTGLIPAVLLEIPAWWATIESPVPLMGQASPGTVIDWELLDDDGLALDSGEIIAADDDGFFAHEVDVVLDRSQVMTVILTSDDVTVERVFRVNVD